MFEAVALANFVPVVLAGGSGTRFWPRSRRVRAKQVLALSGTETMIQQTCERLLPLVHLEQIFVITNDLLAGTIAHQIPGLSSHHILREPVGRNTAPACGLAGMIALQSNPDAVLGIFPSDHIIADRTRFVERLRQGIHIAATGENIVVMGAPPTRAETGYGYIESGPAVKFGALNDVRVTSVLRFTEKPDVAHASKFVAAGNYSWNSGMFLWSARTLVGAIREHCPALFTPLSVIARAYGTPDFYEVFADLYPTVESISIDVGVLEPRSLKGEAKSKIYCLPADFGWNDLGSWMALHEHKSGHLHAEANGNVVEAETTLHFEAEGNYVYAPGMAVALLGVNGLVVVQTEDALLVTTGARSQEVGRIVKEFSRLNRTELV